MASLKDCSRKARTIFTLDTPSNSFLQPQWPDISPTVSNDILTKLLKILTDLQELQKTSTSTLDGPPFLVGPNPVTIHLEQLASLSIPPTLPAASSKSKRKPKTNKPAVINSTSSKLRKPLAVFVTRSDQPSQLHAHLPLLCSLSSTPLIPLPKNSEKKLVNVLKPDNGRVLFLLLFNDTQWIEELRGTILNDDGEAVVGKVAAPDALKTGQWFDTRSVAVQTFVGQPKKRKDNGGNEKAAAGTPSKKVRKEGER
ncbi:hypothetical protein ABW19_dt0202534 [Dactylella cylindrospora]|nr:hypothetical protein ABW19_dt0202534 [Dactylella cylindrospora]